MQNPDDMQAKMTDSYLYGGSAAYIEALYEAFLQDPNTIPDNWKAYFESLPLVNGHTGADISHAQIRESFATLAKMPRTAAPISAGPVDANHERLQSRVWDLINAYRNHGHHLAKLDPLDLAQRTQVPDLDLAFHQLGPNDLETVFNVEGFASLKEASLKTILEHCQQTYCGSIGIEYMHISDSEQVKWLRDRIESTSGRPNYDADFKTWIYNQLFEAEALEKYLGSKYVGQKRFSLEGGDSLIPMLEDMILRSGQHGIKEAVIGMAHRGRLNVLVNIFGKATQDLFAEFEGKHRDELRSGDVKYHMGFSSDVNTPGGPMHIVLAFNPSHLEIINPVVQGSVRARAERRDDQHRDEVLPILIHGDAAVAGQGVVMEILNMSQARGYSTGGSLHIVVNNQIGFTTSNPLDARSTLYCTDIFKMVQAPVLHVNGDDPEAVVFAAQIALDYRMKFKKDVVIDLVCYRRHGHNEADEPAATQPIMYNTIRALPTTPTLYAKQLTNEGVLTQAYIDEFSAAYRARLDAGESVVELCEQDYIHEFEVDWTPYLGHQWDEQVNTRLSLRQVEQLGERLSALPEGFTLQKQVEKVMRDRHDMLIGKKPLNWGAAENLAYASLLSEGYSVRISGQDCGRGTFSHRLAELHDFNNGDTYIPLQSFCDRPHQFSVINSVLSEEGVLGFEYGYACSEPNALVIWEAQFGDFANGAQVLIDQFISSGEQKWGRMCGLALFLPHGYEGMGPEHSSARLERFLQLSSQQNMQVCVPTTPAQCYHMLRRQMLRPFRRPLIVFTPKSLLRHPLAISTIEDISDGQFHLVIPEIDEQDIKQVKRVIICCGKVYYDLLDHRRKQSLNHVAIVRVEQLYPFPEKELKAVLEPYKHVNEFIWCQEEPKNQGAWYRTVHRLERALSGKQALKYAGRASSASTAAGYTSLHREEQAEFVDTALVKAFKAIED